MPFIPLEQLLRPTTIPEQEIFLTAFFTKFNNNSAAFKNIRLVEPLFYEGTIAGSEFLTYANNKLYICFDLLISRADSTNNASAGTVRYRDEANTVIFDTTNISVLYTGLAVGYNMNMIQINNLYFSRLSDIVLFDMMRFIGYRITVS